eukprot:Clim_evm12s108 gene=Clim_evmTU12s108
MCAAVKHRSRHSRRKRRLKKKHRRSAKSLVEASHNSVHSPSILEQLGKFDNVVKVASGAHRKKSKSRTRKDNKRKHRQTPNSIANGLHNTLTHSSTPPPSCSQASPPPLRRQKLNRYGDSAANSYLANPEEAYSPSSNIAGRATVVSPFTQTVLKFLQQIGKKTKLLPQASQELRQEKITLEEPTVNDLLSVERDQRRRKRRHKDKERIQRERKRLDFDDSDQEDDYRDSGNRLAPLHSRRASPIDLETHFGQPQSVLDVFNKETPGKARETQTSRPTKSRSQRRRERRKTKRRRHDSETVRTMTDGDTIVILSSDEDDTAEHGQQDQRNAKSKGKGNDNGRSPYLLRNRPSLSSPDTTFSGGATKHDLESLAPAQWLNDGVINAYLRLLERYVYNVESHGSKQGMELTIRPRGKVRCFSTFFWPSLQKEGAEATVRSGRWTRRCPDLLQRRYWHFPIHSGAHWTFVTWNAREGKLIFMDSMGGSGNRVLRLLEEYINLEISNQVLKTPYTEKTKGTDDAANSISADALAAQMERSMNLETDEVPSAVRAKGTVRAIPRQRNGYDCGVFVCQYAVYMSLKMGRPPDRCFQQDDIAELRKVMIKDLEEDTFDNTVSWYQQKLSKR